MAKTGRPPIEINQKQFETLCGIQCTLSEIAAVFACSEDTVERWAKKTYELPFADIYKNQSGQQKNDKEKYAGNCLARFMPDDHLINCADCKCAGKHQRNQDICAGALVECFDIGIFHDTYLLK